MGDCWTIMTHSITICTDHGVVVQINYVTKEIALLSFVIRLPGYINDKSLYDCSELIRYETVLIH